MGSSFNKHAIIANLCASVSLCEEALTYDADGNMTADERGWHYVWNGENRLVCASNDEVVVTYAYDHRGRMVRKEISHRDTEPRRIEYLWDNWNIIRETTNCQTVQPSNCQTDYVWGLDLDGTLQGAGGVGGLLTVFNSNSNSNSNSSLATRSSSLYFPAYDANGNVTEYVSTKGDIVAHYEYSAFGEPLISSGELASTFTHQFSTKPYCTVTGFIEYQMRKYRPHIGRWMSRDPLLESSFRKTLQNRKRCRFKIPKEHLLFVLMNNNPIRYFDILGLDNPGCDLPSPMNPELWSEENADCYRRCCAMHDECYSQHGCSMYSWGQNITGVILSLNGCRFCSIIIPVISPCARCNSEVFACFAGCCTGSHSPPETQKKWFCPNGPNKGQRYDDWWEIPESCWESGKRPTPPPPGVGEKIKPETPENS